MNPVPVLGWDAGRPEWLASRRTGIGASDVDALLGFSKWRSPWELWAEKTGHLTQPEKDDEAILLGRMLEPWLIEQAPALLGMEVTRTPHMLYHHAEADWRLCSPDAFAFDDGLVEAKTAKLAGWGDPEGWEDDGVPLGYEFQARWQMHVMNRPRVHFVALIAGMGRITRTVERDLPLEYDLVRQVSEWRQKHLIDGTEPPITAADVDALNRRYHQPNPDIPCTNPDCPTKKEHTHPATTDLDGTEALEWWQAYKEGARLIREGEQLQAEPKALFRAALGNATAGKLDGRLLVTWNERKAAVNWQRMAEDLATKLGIPLPDPNLYRGEPSRTLLVK